MLLTGRYIFFVKISFFKSGFTDVCFITDGTYQVESERGCARLEFRALKQSGEKLTGDEKSA